MQSGKTPSQDELEQVVEHLKAALLHYKRILDHHPEDEDVPPKQAQVIAALKQIGINVVGE